MGKLLEALKKKNIDLNKNGAYKEKFIQDQAKTLLISAFNKLPEEKRYELLDEFLSPEAKETQTKGSFESMLQRVKKQGKDASREFLSKNDSFGRPVEELVAPMERCMRGWVDLHYREEGVTKDSPAVDKVNALFRCQTFQSRMSFMWGLVDEKRKPGYQRQFLTETTRDPAVCAKFLNKQGVFAGGKDWGKLAEAVDAALDEASLDDAAKSIDAFKGPDHKASVEALRKSVGQNTANRADKVQLLMQHAMLTPEDDLDPDDLSEKADRSKWEQRLDPVKKAGQLSREGKVDIGKITERSKRIIGDATKQEDIRICKEAALQNYRALKFVIPVEQQSSKEFKEMERHAAELQIETVKHKYADNAENIDKGRELIAGEIQTIEKEKSGFLLSKTNSPEHDNMTKSLRLFNAKMDMVLGKKPSQELSAEELEKVNKTDIKNLFDEAKRSTFNYSCLKTKNGKGSILHRDGRNRNTAARNTFDLLNQLGSRLGLSDAATEMKDKTALSVLENRGSETWEKNHAEDCAAKTIYAMSLSHKGIPADKQTSLLADSAVESGINDIKQDPAFKQMVKNLGATGLCETLVKGSDALTLAYAQAAEQIKNPQAGKGKAQPQMTVQQQLQNNSPAAGGPVA